MSDDVIKALRSFVADPPVSGAYLLSLDNAKDILAELDRLRSLAGAVTPGPDFVDLRNMLNGSGPDKPKTEYPDWMSMK